MASERCACGHDLHEPGQCGDKRLTFDCGCSYSPDTQPAPREILTREGYVERIHDCYRGQGMSIATHDVLMHHDAALRAEVEAWKARFRALTDSDSPDMAGNAFIREKARADRLAEALREIAHYDAIGWIAIADGRRRIAAAALKRENTK